MPGFRFSVAIREASCCWPDGAAAGADFTNVVNMRVCLRDAADFPKFNETFAEILAGEKVTRTCIGGTPHRKGVNVEIDCIAMFD